MPLASDYLCYSVRCGMRKTGLLAKTLIDIGVGCAVTGVQAERVARFAAKTLRVRLGKVYIKDVTKGRAHMNNTAITLPHWIFHNHTKAFIIYYIVHEVAHLHKSAHGHGPAFKRVERRALKRFGLGIRYLHAYPRQLFALKDGRVFFEERALRRA